MITRECHSDDYTKEGRPLAPSNEAPLVRAAVVASAIVTLVVIHVAMRFLMATLHGFATYLGLPRAIPVVEFFGYVVVAALVVATVARRVWPGFVLGTDLFIFAIEPCTSTIHWRDGCEVVGGAFLSLIPDMTVRLGAVTLGAWNGACTASVNIVLMCVGVLWIAVGLRLSTLPEVSFDRWLSLINRIMPS